MARQYGFVHQLSTGLYKQATFGTAGTDNTELDYNLSPSSPASLNINFGRELQSEFSGQEWELRALDSRTSVSLDASFHLTNVTGAMIIPMAWGAIAKDAGPDPFIYTAELQASGIGLPVGQFIIEGFHGSDIKLYDMGCASFSVSGSGSQDNIIEISSSWMGSGNFTEDVGAYTTPAIDRSSKCRMGGLALTLGPIGAQVAIASRVRSFTYDYNNNIDETINYAPGGGLLATRFDAGARRTHNLTMEIEGDASDDLFDYYNAQTRLGCVITMTDDGGSDYVKLTFLELEVLDLTPNVGDDVTYTLTLGNVNDPSGSGYNAAYPSGVYCDIRVAAANDLNNTPLTSYTVA